MNRIALKFMPLLVLIPLVACIPDTVPATEPTTENPTATLPAPTLTPTVKPTSKPEPTLTPTPEPTLTPTQVPPTLKPEPTLWEPKRPNQPCEPSNSRTCAFLYILAELYDDEHVLKTQLHLERAGYTTFVASNTLEVIRGYHECYDYTPAYPDLLLEDVDVGDYDAILFAGLDGISTELHNNPEAHRIAQDAVEQRIVVAAVGDGPVILAKAGVLKGKTVNVLNNARLIGIDDQWINAIERNGAIFTDHSPVRDGLLITADFVSIRFIWGIIEMMEEQFQ